MSRRICSFHQFIAAHRRDNENSPLLPTALNDFNVRNPEKTTEKLRYIHRNPVTRGLVANPEDWPWSSFRHYATGIESTVEIESFWSASKRRNQLPEFI